MPDGISTHLRPLFDCQNVHCKALSRYLTHDRELNSLGYEDLFFPLRHHHDEGLTMVLETRGSEAFAERELYWGSGDWIYDRISGDLPDPIVDPALIWTFIQKDAYDITFHLDTEVAHA